MSREEKKSSREVLVLHDDYDEPLAKLLVSYLQGKAPGIVFTHRNARYGCNSNCYLNVIRLNKVKCPDFVKGQNVREASTLPYEEASEKYKYTKLTKREHFELQAAELADKILGTVE